MRYWTDEGHLTDVALEHWASDELQSLESPERRALTDHLRACAACRIAAEPWERLVRALAALPRPEPSPGFDDAVMARVRSAAAKPAAASDRAAALWQRARRAAMGVAAGWTAAVIGSAIWMATRIETAPAVLLAAGVEGAREFLWASVVKVAAILHLSGTLELWSEAAQKVPGPGVLSAVAMMTAISAVAFWMLYRAVDLKNPRLKAHV